MLLKNVKAMCLNQYGLDPVFWYTVPNFAFDALLKLTGIKLDLVFDQEMYEMIEAGLRGGMTQTIPARKYKQIIHIWELIMKIEKQLCKLFGRKQLIWFKHDTKTTI